MTITAFLRESLIQAGQCPYGGSVPNRKVS